MTQAQTIGTIRERGQLTIPDEVRQKYDWASPGSVVTISTQKATEIVIRPYSPLHQKIDWNRLWNDIELSRSYTGKYAGSLSEFIVQDREKHE